MRKVNAKGRNKHEAHIRLHRGVTNSEAWKTLSCEATRLLIFIWERHNGTNNGTIPYSWREARAALRVGSKKVPAAFRELEERGFLICRSASSFRWKVGAGEGKAREWEITTEPCEGQLAKKLYRDWTEKQNTATTVGAGRNHSGSRSRNNSQRQPPIGNCSGSRSDRFEPSSGNHSGNTYNIPEGVPPFIRPARLQPSLETLQKTRYYAGRGAGAIGGTRPGGGIDRKLMA